eukprot:6241-Pleurochrysis_carterae.AAC.3
MPDAATCHSHRIMSCCAFAIILPTLEIQSTSSAIFGPMLTARSAIASLVLVHVGSQADPLPHLKKNPKRFVKRKYVVESKQQGSPQNFGRVYQQIQTQQGEVFLHATRLCRRQGLCCGTSLLRRQPYVHAGESLISLVLHDDFICSHLHTVRHGTRRCNFQPTRLNEGPRTGQPASSCCASILKRAQKELRHILFSPAGGDRLFKEPE